MINGKVAALCSLKHTIGRSSERAGGEIRIVFAEDQRNDRERPLFAPRLSQMGGWSDAFAYVSIRDAYLPGFKILPSVQFSARM